MPSNGGLRSGACGQPPSGRGERSRYSTVSSQPNTRERSRDSTSPPRGARRRRSRTRPRPLLRALRGMVAAGRRVLGHPGHPSRPHSLVAARAALRPPQFDHGLHVPRLPSSPAGHALCPAPAGRLMPWGRVDDTFHSHPKVMSIPPDIRMAAVGLHWMAISWCNAHLTDGRVPSHAIAALGGTDEQASALVRARLWHRAGRSYRVHDFLDFNASRVSTEERHRARVEAGKAGAAVRWRKGSSAVAPARPLLDSSDSRRMATHSSRAGVPSRPTRDTKDSQQPTAVGARDPAEDDTWFDAPPGAAVDPLEVVR